MSCFGGRMKEYERISLDRFDGKNLQSTVYFLSHLHEDHTVGLGEPLFFKRLKSNKTIHLYCSEVTEVLLCASKKYQHLSPFIKSVPVNTPTTIVIPDPLFDEKETVTITLLPAFHCPGSVMCLFEGHEGNVIYTGDYRWEHFDIEQMHHLRSGERVKKIDSLYMDTTFCCPNNLYIPSRQQCIEAVYQLVREWISQGPQYAVYIYLRAQYGHEPLINSLAVQLKKKIHVNEHKASVYDRIQEFHNNFTPNGTDTQIHACGKNCTVDIDGERVPCRQQYDDDKVLVILPTTMYFTQFQHLTLDKVIRRINDNFYRACYSFHSSYVEIKDLLSYLRPDKVYPNVKPPSDSSLAETQNRLNTMLKECLVAGRGDEPETEEVKVTQLGTLKTRSRGQGRKRKQTVTSETESLDFGTPTKKTKAKETTESETTVSTRRSSRRLQQTATQEIADKQQKTPKKGSGGRKKSTSPDVFLTPVKSEKSDISIHSSYDGSHHGSEIDLTQSLESQSSLTAEASREDITETSWSLGSFLSAVKSSSLEDNSCIVVEEDEEQTDEHFVDQPVLIDAGDNKMDLANPQEDDDTGVDNKNSVDEVDGKDVKTPKKKAKGSGRRKGKAAKSTKANKLKASSGETEEIKIELGQTDRSSTKDESFSSEATETDKICRYENKNDDIQNAEVSAGNATETYQNCASDLMIQEVSIDMSVDQESQLHGQANIIKDKPPRCQNEDSIQVSSSTDGLANVETKVDDRDMMIIDLCEEKEDHENDPEVQISNINKLNIDMKSNKGSEVYDQSVKDINQTTLNELNKSPDNNDVALKEVRPIAVSHSIMETNVDNSDLCANEEGIKDVVEFLVVGNNKGNIKVKNDSNSVILEKNVQDLDQTKLSVKKLSKVLIEDVKEGSPIAENESNMKMNVDNSEQIILCDESGIIRDVSENHDSQVLTETGETDKETKNTSLITSVPKVNFSEPVKPGALMADKEDIAASFDDKMNDDINETKNPQEKYERTENDENNIDSEHISHPISQLEPIESSKTEIDSSEVLATSPVDTNSKDNKDSEDFWNYSSLMIQAKTTDNKQDDNAVKTVSPEKKSSPIRRMRFYRSRSFDMFNENEDNSEFCTKETPKQVDPPDAEIYYAKLAYCFENKEANDINEKLDSDNQIQSTNNSERDKPIEIVDDVIDLTGDDDLPTTTMGSTSMKFDANVGYKNEGGKKLMTISFSKSKDRVLKSKTLKNTKVADSDGGENDVANYPQEKISMSDNEHMTMEKDVSDLNEKHNLEENLNSDVKNKTANKDDGLPKEDEENIKELNEEEKVLSEKNEKELEEREELRRQAYGLMLETDSDSDSDSTVGPQSPSVNVLYDEYIELSSGDDDDDDDASKNKESATSKETNSQRENIAITVLQNITDKNNDSEPEPECAVRGIIMDDEPTTRTITVRRVTVNKKAPSKEGPTSTFNDENINQAGSVSTSKGNAEIEERRKGYEDKDEIYIDDDDDRGDDRSSGWLSSRNSRRERRRSRSSSDEDYDYDYKRRMRIREKNKRRKEREKRKKAEKAQQAEREKFLSSTPDLFQRYRRSINPTINQDKTSETSSSGAQFFWNYNDGSQKISAPGVTYPSLSQPYSSSIPSLSYSALPSSSISAQSAVSTPSLTAVPPPTFVPPPFGVPPPSVIPSPFSVPPPTAVPPPLGIPPPIGVPPPTGVPPPISLPTQTAGIAVTRKSRFSGGSSALSVPALSLLALSTWSGSSSSTSTALPALSTGSGSSSSTSTVGTSPTAIDVSAVQKAAIALSSMTKSTNSDISQFKSKIFEVTGLKSILNNVKKQTAESHTTQNQTALPVSSQQSSVMQEKEDLPTLIKKLDEVKQLLEATRDGSKQSETRTVQERAFYFDDKREYSRLDRRYDDRDIYDDRRRSRDARYGRHDDGYGPYEDDLQYYDDRLGRDIYDDDPYEGMPPPHPSDPYYEDWMEYFRERRYRREIQRPDHVRSGRYGRPPVPTDFDRHSLYAEAHNDYDPPMSYQQRPPPLSRHHDNPHLTRPREGPPLTRAREGPTLTRPHVSGLRGREDDGIVPREQAYTARPQRGGRQPQRFMGPASNDVRPLLPFASSTPPVRPSPKVRVLSRSGKVSLLDQPLPGTSTHLPGPSRSDGSGHDFPVFLTGIQKPRRF